jgi:glycosyltransferase involved in cell wall biosynthesis
MLYDATNIIKIDIVVPAYNEERLLEAGIDKLVTFLRTDFTYKNYNIIIVNNGSTDKTFDIMQRLQRKYKEVTCLNLNQKGRGLALKTAWLASKADILSYMDADLSTGLEATPDLIDSIVNGGYDLAVGSRFLSDSKVKRRFTRTVLSYAYNLCIKMLCGIRQLPDLQCGFKAINKKVANRIVPKIKNKNWFFDTELLILAQESGFRIKYIPINWIERLESKVKILCAICESIIGIFRLLIRSQMRLFWLKLKTHVR